MTGASSRHRPRRPLGRRASRPVDAPPRPRPRRLQRRDEIETVMATTDAMKEVLGRDVPRVPALRGRTIITLFYEASTRTRASFELAGKALGADVINVAAGGSSVEKGESLDRYRAHAASRRRGRAGHAPPGSRARRTSSRGSVQAAVINAGDGWHAHPTQALLDLYTMRTHLGDVRGKRIVIVGDIAHSRVARSNIWALSTRWAPRSSSARRPRCSRLECVPLRWLRAPALTTTPDETSRNAPCRGRDQPRPRDRRRRRRDGPAPPEGADARRPPPVTPRVRDPLPAQRGAPLPRPHGRARHAPRPDERRHRDLALPWRAACNR